MTDWLVDTMLGEWGRAVLAFYSANALPINLVIVAYGAVLLLLHRRLAPYRAVAVEEARRALAGRRVPSRTGPLHEQVASAIDWERVAAVGPGRLVVGRWRLWPTRVSAASLPRLLPIGELCRDAA
jgi:hypothetical protein